MNKNIKDQLKHQLDCRLIAFGMLGKWNKPQYTKTGRPTKNRKFIRHPLQIEATEILKNLLENNITESEVFKFLQSTRDEFIKAKNINIELYNIEIERI